MTTTPMYNPQEGLRGKREGGPYLDEVELQRDAERRAKELTAVNKAKVGEDTDYEVVTAEEILAKGGVIGLVPAEQLIDNVYSNPSSVNAGKPGSEEAFKQAVHSSGTDEDNLAVPVNTDVVSVPEPVVEPVVTTKKA